MVLLKVTARRAQDKLIAESREVVAAVEDGPDYWEPACRLIIAAMRRDGIIQDDCTADSALGQGESMHKEVSGVV